MKRIVLLTVLVAALFTPARSEAQATSSSRLGWDQAAPTLAEAQGYTYRYYADGSTTGVVATATCTGTASPFACTIPFPAFTPGNHTITLSAANVAGESAKSAPFAFTFVVVPSAPAGLRIVP